MPEASAASDLVEAHRENEYGLTVPLRVDQVERPDFDWCAQCLHCSDVHGTHVKVTIFDDPDCELTDYAFETDAWYEFSDVNPDVHRGSIGLKVEWTRQVERSSGPPEAPSVDEGAAIRRLGAADSIAALDIETLLTVPESEFDGPDPTQQELLCTGLGYRNGPAAEVETEVLFRRDRSAEGELAAIEAAVDWLESRDPEVLVTFAGTAFDLPLLIGRAESIAGDLGNPDRARRVSDVLESFRHADLWAAKNRVLGQGSLEDMAAEVGAPAPSTHWTEYEIGVSPEAWREKQWPAMREAGRDPPSDDVDDSVVYNTDVPHLGDAWLSAKEAGDDQCASKLHECLETYTAADIDPLFAIADDSRVEGQPAFQMTYEA